MTEGAQVFGFQSMPVLVLGGVRVREYFAEVQKAGAFLSEAQAARPS